MRRDGWLPRLGPWVGIGTSPAALMAGGGVGEKLAGPPTALALAIGVTLLAALAVTQGVLGQRTGRSLSALTAGPLGALGSRRTASVVMVLMMVGWFGVNVGVAGVATARLAGVPDPVGIVLFAAVMLAVAGVGLGALSWAALAAGLATTGVAAYGLHLAFAHHQLTLSGGTAGRHPAPIGAAVVLVVGYGAAFSLRTPDFTRDLARPRQVVWCALAGLAIPTFAFGLAGAALQAVTGTWDLADVLRGLGSPGVAYGFAALGFAGSVLTNVWSGALSLSDAVPRLGHRTALGAIAVLGTLVATAGFADLMLGWLTVMALAAPGLVAICVVHAARGGSIAPGWRSAGLLSWTLGFACGIALDMAGSALALPVAAALPAAVFWALGRTEARKLSDAKAGG